MKNVILSVVALVVVVGPPVFAAGGAEETPTFTKDVAPIIFENCITCHRPNHIAPMTLGSYEEVRPWARSIKDVVVARVMPPWGADPQNSLKSVSYTHLTLPTIYSV